MEAAGLKAILVVGQAQRRHWPLGLSSALAAVAGFANCPLGLAFSSGAGSEGKLIGLAHASETAAPARRTPRFLPSFDERRDGW